MAATVPPGTRQRLLDAGTELFLGQGFDATSLDQVRQHAGASNGSLYHHFPTKAHLARALYLDALAAYHAAMRPALAGNPPAAEGTRALVDRHIRWVVSHPAQARVLSELRGAVRVDGQWPDWTLVNRDAMEALQHWLDVEMAAGRMRAMSLDTWLALVLAPSMKLAEGWLRLARPRVEPAERALLAEAAARAVTLDPVTKGRR